MGEKILPQYDSYRPRLANLRRRLHPSSGCPPRPSQRLFWLMTSKYAMTILSVVTIVIVNIYRPNTAAAWLMCLSSAFWCTRLWVGSPFPIRRERPRCPKKHSTAEVKAKLRIEQRARREYHCRSISTDTEHKQIDSNTHQTYNNAGVIKRDHPITRLAKDHSAEENIFDFVVVGAGYGGLSAAAVAKKKGLSTLVIERTEEIGDIWRNRYDRVELHDVTDNNHLPFFSIDSKAPVFLDKDEVADYMSEYAAVLNLNCITKTRVTQIEYLTLAEQKAYNDARFRIFLEADRLSTSVYEKKGDYQDSPDMTNFDRHADHDDYSSWYSLTVRDRIRIATQSRVPSKERASHPYTRVVYSKWVLTSTGGVAVPEVPEMNGLEQYQGKISHSFDYRTGARFHGKKILIIGNNNSGCEIALDSWEYGAEPVILSRGKFNISSQEAIQTLQNIGGRWPFIRFLYPLVWLINNIYLAIDSRLKFGDLIAKHVHIPWVGPRLYSLLTMINPMKKGFKRGVIDKGCAELIRQDQVRVLYSPENLRFYKDGIIYTDPETKTERLEEYDAVIFATGYHLAHLCIQMAFAQAPEPWDYKPWFMFWGNLSLLRGGADYNVTSVIESRPLVGIKGYLKPHVVILIVLVLYSLLCLQFGHSRIMNATYTTSLTLCLSLNNIVMSLPLAMQCALLQGIVGSIVLRMLQMEPCWMFP